MAWSASDLTALDAAIASGVQEVRFSDGRQVRYASMADLLRARSLVAAEANANAAAPVNRTSFAEFSRG
jgi:hypothetical protein